MGAGVRELMARGQWFTQTNLDRVVARYVNSRIE